MIADLIDSALNLRFITRNVLSVYSTSKEFTDSFIRKLKHSSYKVNHQIKQSDEIISYIKKDYNIYENIFRYVKNQKFIRFNKFLDYLCYLNLSHLLFLHFYQLSDDDTTIIEILLQLADNKPIVITDYIDKLYCKDRLYTLLFHVGLENRLIIVPFRNIYDAVNNSTCQCYIKNPSAIKIQSAFSNDFINTEFNTSLDYYNGLRPILYKNQDYSLITPSSYTYSIYELILILLFSLKMIFISLYNWGTKI